MSAPAGGVVIATRNRPERLARCLAALANQTESDFEVIVVDDHSDSPLDEVVHAPELSSLNVTLVRLSQQSGPAAARNAGVERVTSELLLFVDDDVVAARRFVEVHIDTVREHSATDRPIVSCGPFVQPADWEATPWNLWEARQAKKEADAMLRGDYEPTWRQFHTGNNCMPTATFRAAGGFDEAFKRAEDDEFALRLHDLGCEFRFESEAIAWHYSNRSLEAWLSIPSSYAFFDVQIDRLHPDADYLATKKAELARRKLPLRIVRAICNGKVRTRLGVSAAVAAAKALSKIGMIDASMGALSVAYDLRYVRSLHDAEASSC